MLGPLAVAYLAVTEDAVGGEVSVAVAAAVFAAAMSIFPTDPHQAHLTINALTCLRAFGRLREELTQASTVDTGSARPAPPMAAPLIRVEDVCFAYPGTDRQVLDHLDLEVRPGELLAVVGLNGAGKSTLIRLLAWLYEPTSGRITADGVDLAAIGPNAWRNRISVVFQDFVRYHLSAADNVALGNASVPRDENALAAAARDAGLDEVLARLPRGWETPLARSRTGGVDLSGGQWQQVVLARALYAVRTGAQLLVLDEPTAHLDVRTEFDVFSRLAAHKGDATAVLISHRLSTVRQADRIVLLDGGRIAEAGSHDELMALAGWTIFTLGFGAGLSLVVYRSAGGDGSLGGLVLAIIVAVTLRDALQDTLFGVNVAMEGRTGAESLLWLRDYALGHVRDTGTLPPPDLLRDGITFEEVSFTYSGLAKFYAPDEGRILVDGVDLAELSTSAWRARSSAAFQDFGRFHVRFGDAVGIGDLPHLDDDARVLDAVRAADATPLVERLPAGLDTQLGRQFDGVELSEGQWQKTALARASMRVEPLLFVLDEPTASLDAPSEHAIFERCMARARELADRTGAITVVISHRFSTVTGADHILVLDRGRLVEQGTHQELIAASGRYADLYTIQATAYAVVSDG